MPQSMTREQMISALDTAVGMLLVAAMRDPRVKQAMEKVSAVSRAIAESLDNEDKETA